MNSKERVLYALSHKTPDRTPRFVWLGGEIRKKLTKRYNISPNELNIKIGNDILQTWVSINGEMERDVPQDTEFTDDFGITWKRDGEYNMVVRNPLRGLSASEIEAYKLPCPYRPSRYKALEELIHSYGNEYFIGADVSGSLFEPAYHLRHMEDFMMDMASGDETAGILLDKLAEFTITVSLECIKRGADWIWLGDDLGSQQGMLIAPDMWRRYFKPRMKRIIAELKKARPDLPVAYHSCGSMSPVIGDLVEIGIDVLNPIQESAAGMDQLAVKAAFGDKLTLMCGPDTQQFLNKADPETVYAETRKKTELLGKNGGYIFGVSHHIQGDTPDENMDAMFRAL